MDVSTVLPSATIVNVQFGGGQGITYQTQTTTAVWGKRIFEIYWVSWQRTHGRLFWTRQGFLYSCH